MNTLKFLSALIGFHAWLVCGFATELHVGADRRFTRIENALAAAHPGDTIVVHPALYEQVALRVTMPVVIRAAATNIVLDGASFDYSGAGKIPRAIVQFEPTASGSTLDGFILDNARNTSHNSAGIRINQANNITLTNCVIRACDMGVMSNGDVGRHTATNQLITHCIITRNGAPDDPGYSHNLYLGGTDVTLRHCEISFATAGHNVKSRAHITRVEDSFIHHAANRELDFVDASGNTDRPNSDVFLLRNTIAKDPDCSGNRNLIHVGRDGSAERTGALYAVSNTFSSPFQTALIDLSSRATAHLHHNVVSNSPASAQLLSLRHPDARAFGHDNRFPKNLSITGLLLCED